VVVEDVSVSVVGTTLVCVNVVVISDVLVCVVGTVVV